MWQNIYNKTLWEENAPVKWAGRSVQYFEELDSTNLEATRVAAAGACHGTLIVADRQTQGRGRRGRSWESPAGKNLYFSLVLRPQWEPEKSSMVTLVMAHSVARAMEASWSTAVREKASVQTSGDIVHRAGIKWPNDILLNSKKVCGILTEMRLQNRDIQYIIVGVGINVKEQEFAGELSEKASSLSREWGVEISREMLLQNIMEAFEEDYARFETAGDLTPLLDGYQSRLLNLNKEVKVLDPQGAFEGIAGGITSNGELIVEKTDGSICHIYAGEVSVRGMQGYV